MNQQEEFRRLPSVDEAAAAVAARVPRLPRRLIVAETRRVIEGRRLAVKSGHPVPAEPVVDEVTARLEELARPSLRQVINATGVVLHTNLGRAPWPDFPLPRGYSNLEFDLAAGQRGKRDTHLQALMERLFGCPGIVVNNNAAAVYLALAALASGWEVIVSRGELIEIGDGFRIPEIMAQSGARLREVGTTNRTHIEDYRAAVNERTRLLMRVHPSNFHITGFTSRPALAELAALSRETGIPLYEDLGSGCLADLTSAGVDEPVVSGSLQAGADLVSFSGDKLLGGPQAGFLVGRADIVTKLRRHAMFRALRLDKCMYAALEATLRHTLFEEWDRIPALARIRETPASVRARAEGFVGRLEGVAAELIPGKSVIGGGSTPDQTLATWLIAIAGPEVVAWERRLRQGNPPVVARIEEGRLLLDLRSVPPEEEELLLAALRAAIPSR